MAIMMSASFAFAQSNNSLMNFTVHINAVNPTNHIDKVVESATITYRFCDEYGIWSDWKTIGYNTLTPDWITFWVNTYSHTNSQIVKIDYILRAYTCNGSILVSSHCDTSVVTNGCTLTVNSWNHCRGGISQPAEPIQNTTE